MKMTKKQAEKACHRFAKEYQDNCHDEAYEIIKDFKKRIAKLKKKNEKYKKQIKKLKKAS